MTGTIKHPIRCIFFIPHKFVNIPRLVATIKTGKPHNPEIKMDIKTKIIETMIHNFR